MSAARNLLTVWSRLVADSLWSAGLRQAVISPGSRSTPLLAALLADERWQLFSKQDERVASFFALGLAKASGSPPLLLCTSGSAGAHYYPAVLEAEMARLPLVIVTADRPPELHDCGAPQTVDQQNLYGSHVRYFCDLGVPSETPEALNALIRTCTQAARSSLGPPAGAVHLNMPARKPLEPLAEAGRASGRAEEALERAASRLAVEQMADQPLIPEVPVLEQVQLESLVALLEQSETGLVVAGPQPLLRPDDHLGRASEMAAQLGFVFAPEATSGLRFGQDSALPSFSALMRCDGSADLLPDLVVQIGRPPVATAWYGFVDRLLESGGKLVVISS